MEGTNWRILNALNPRHKNGNLSVPDGDFHTGTVPNSSLAIEITPEIKLENLKKKKTVVRTMKALVRCKTYQFFKGLFS